ncbi:MAG: amylo-alpha-1,6-glucosidase [Candidatus Dormibacteraeota bacterium]|nr:amylo-alpha-1,6-glucosidase [Candidatus Dormibacteraeota bacterium]
MTVLQDRVILKQNDVFVVSDPSGDIPAGDEAGMGLYRSDTRFLSLFELRLNGRRPILLNYSVDRAYVATFQLVNPALEPEVGSPAIPRQSISLRRTRFVHQGMHERIGLQNCNRHPVQVELELRFDADFLDIFEVRGYHPLPMGGVREPAVRDETGFSFGYRGLDGLRRSTEVVFNPLPRIGSGRAVMPVSLGPQETFVLLVDVLPWMGDDEPLLDFHFDAELEALERRYQAWNTSSTRFATDNETLDQELLWRNLEDLRVLCDEKPSGLVPTAGTPWYAVPFGRDALITSFQTLALNPELARGSIRYLAEHQGRRVDPEREEEPGKIFHEIRFGELARLGIVPHTPYYGTVDATPLFLVLLVELLDWTGDQDLLSELFPHVMAALEWIDNYGDLDQDGFVEYAQHGSVGVRNQGWKDSYDSLVENYGVPAPLPAALVEVQGYVYHAKAGLARIFNQVGLRANAARLETEAEELRKRFNDLFWMPDLGYYAQALDRDKRQVSSVTSNPGHCLLSGIVDRRRAEDVVSRLMAPDMFSGWGIRTVSTEAVNYNPMSYHNGSVWPHDNSLIAAGMRRYGFHREAELVARSVLEACLRFPDHRIPELFCGFVRDQRFGAGPGEYLVSCSPQAWGAGSLFHFLQTLTGVEADLTVGRLRIDPVETPLYNRLRVEGMRVGEGELDFTIECGEGVRVKVDRVPPEVTRLELPA